MTYNEQLRDDRWITLRDQVVTRDFGLCQHCMSSRRLNVHHKEYIEGRQAWQYPMAMLITLCEECHKQWHATHAVKVNPKEKPTIEELFERVYRDVAILKRLNKR